MKRADTWKAKGDFDTAIADFNEAIRLNPKDPSRVCSIEANFWLAKGDFDKAVADCNEAIRLNPKYTWAFKKRAEILVFAKSEPRQRQR